MGNNLKFITKKKCTSKADISISLVGKKELATSIILRNNADRSISTTDYLTVAISGERLYFKGTTAELGYKMSSHSSKLTKMVSIKDEELNEFALTHSGDYKLQFDRDIKLFYIDTE